MSPCTPAWMAAMAAREPAAPMPMTGTVDVSAGDSEQVYRRDRFPDRPGRVTDLVSLLSQHLGRQILLGSLLSERQQPVPGHTDLRCDDDAKENSHDGDALLAQMKLWEPPAVRVLIVATSGRFATDAVDWIESHNERGERPRIEMWASSHLELILSRKPHIAAAFDLR